ncbi:MAG: hypothetical protein KF690_08595 [Bacteroidetes bacterium]|nr:hypothetical protein [Bacteroidota bacterium]
MELTIADLQLLYGPTLWLAGPLPAPAGEPVLQPATDTVATAPAVAAEAATASAETVPAAEPPSPQEVAGPAWQYLPEAVLAAVVPQPHLDDPDLRELLHKMCAAVGVAPHQLNLLSASFVEDVQLLAAHTRFVLIFGQEIYPSANETISMQSIEIYRLPYLARLLQDTTAKRHAWELMKQFKDRIYERPV